MSFLSRHIFFLEVLENKIFLLNAQLVCANKNGNILFTSHLLAYQVFANITFYF